jgi:hypothetical protein
MTRLLFHRRFLSATAPRYCARTAVSLLVAALAAALSSCAKEQTYVTPLQLGTGGVDKCLNGRIVDTIVLDIMRYEGPQDSSSVLASICRSCSTGEFPGARLARRCLCVGERKDEEAIAAAIAGLRFDEMPPDQPLCARLVGLDRGAAEGPSSGAGTACTQAECELENVERSAVRFCVLSGVTAVSKSGTSVVLSDLAGGDTRVGDLSCSALDRLCSPTRVYACLDYAERCTDGGVELPGIGELEQCLGF